MKYPLVGVIALCVASTALGCRGEPRDEEPAAPRETTRPLALRTDSAGLTASQTALGAEVQLGARFESAVVARRNANGTVTVECHDDQAEAEAFLAGAPRPAKLEVQ